MSESRRKKLTRKAETEQDRVRWLINLVIEDLSDIDQAVSSPGDPAELPHIIHMMIEDLVADYLQWWQEHYAPNR